jgi:hypothetical protein
VKPELKSLIPRIEMCSKYMSFTSVSTFYSDDYFLLGSTGIGISTLLSVLLDSFMLFIKESVKEPLLRMSASVSRIYSVPKIGTDSTNSFELSSSVMSSVLSGLSNVLFS